jgi:hypothetical protein
MDKKLMAQCATVVNKKDISRKQIGGVEHIVVSSYTLPDNVVMNGIMYPADEIEKGYKSLERTLAPVEHPVNANGDFISASDPEAIHNFHAGAFNVNVTRDGGRVHIEKHINVQEALKTDRGKRLLDRINELETSDKPRQIHTSVGLFLTVEELEKPLKNNAGIEYKMIGREFVFDHDAILLDSVGAATPEQGVGMAVNYAGEKIEVTSWEYEALPDISSLHSINEQSKKVIEERLKANADGMSFNQIIEKLYERIKGIVTSEYTCLIDVYQDIVIFETEVGYFSVPYTISGENITLSGMPLRVEKRVEYQPKINKKEGEEHMKELILNALASAGITTDGMSDEELLAEYKKIQANSEENDKTEGEKESVKTVVENALKAVESRLDEMAKQINAKDEKEKEELVKLIANSDKYPGIDEDAAKAVPVESLRKMAASLKPAHGVPFETNAWNEDNTYKAPETMPE